MNGVVSVGCYWVLPSMSHEMQQIYKSARSVRAGVIYNKNLCLQI